MKTQIQRVVIGDSQYLIAEALKVIFSRFPAYIFEGEAGNIPELRTLIETITPDLLVTDFRNIGDGSMDSFVHFRKDYPELHILVLTNHVNRNELNELYQLGVKCVVSKMADEAVIIEAVKAAIMGKKYYSEEILDVLIEQPNKADTSFEAMHLTPAEIEIVKLIATGLTTKAIANKKHISFHTVVSHRKNIFRKLDINSASELVVYALKAGIIKAVDYDI